MQCSCGLPSLEQCTEMWHEVILKETEFYGRAKGHKLRVDTYCMQHPDPYMISAKSFAAHFLGLCITIGHNDDPYLLKSIQDWKFGTGLIEKPKLLDFVGELTISHIVHAQNRDSYERLLQEWAESTWQAYASYHELADEWLSMAVAAQKSKS